MEENNKNNEPLNKDFKVPKIRFSFPLSYKKTTLGTFDNNPMYGLNVSAKSYDGINRYVRITDIDDETHDLTSNDICSPSSFSKDYLLSKGDLLFARTGASVGKTYLYNINQKNQYYYFAGYLIKFHFLNNTIAKFVFFSTQTTRYKKWVLTFSKRSGQPGISSSEFSQFKVYLPKENELNKIVNFFELFDLKIKVLNSKIKTLKKYKEGLVNLCFQNGKQYKISSFVQLVDRRNKDNENLIVYSISNKKGFVIQTEQFYGNEVASSNKENYKIIHKNEFAYNPARINVGSIAYFNNEYGQISPMYIAFSIYGINVILLNEYFHSRYFRKEIKKHLEGSVRQSLSFNNLCDFNININDDSELFGLIFQSINRKLSVLGITLLKIKNLKNYLLENMFI